MGGIERRILACRGTGLGADRPGVELGGTGGRAGRRGGVTKKIPGGQTTGRWLSLEKNPVGRGGG